MPAIREKIYMEEKNMTTILGIELPERNTDATKFQEILTEHGCNIRTRIGMHHGTEKACTNNGIILLDIVGENEDLLNELKEHWNVQVMKF